MAIRYISGASNAEFRSVAKAYDLGLMLTPRTAAVRKTKSKFGPAGLPGGYANDMHIEAVSFTVLDNDAYGAKGKRFIPTWWTWIQAVALMPKAMKDRVLFATAPDVLTWHPLFDDNGAPVMVTKGDRKGEQDVFCIGHAAPTLSLFRCWAPKIRKLGFPVALVAQDGLEDMLDEVPWDLVDWIFIGGSDGFKTGEGAALVTKEAKRRGKFVHMGRVSSLERMELANSWGVDTADGTYLAYGPIENLPNVMSWVDAVNDRLPLADYWHRVSMRRLFRAATGKNPMTGKKEK